MLAEPEQREEKALLRRLHSISITLVSSALMGSVVFATVPPGGSTPANQWEDGIIGAQACGVCHVRELEDWQNTPHANAWHTLPLVDRENPRCQGCHTTGLQAGQTGVQCESCHGPGADYWPEFVMKDPQLAHALGLRKGDDIGTCTRCHTEDTPSIVPFDLREALPLVNHGSRGGSS